jgi:hypothetical protein
MMGLTSLLRHLPNLKTLRRRGSEGTWRENAELAETEEAPEFYLKAEDV